MARDPDYCKLRFAVAKDEDSWPPVDSEGVWAAPLGDGLYRVENIPWFALDVAAEDVFRAVVDRDGLLWAREKVRWSGSCTIRVVPFRDGPLRGDRQAVIDIFSALGVHGEGAGAAYNLVALDVRPNAALATVKSRLRQGLVDGSWEYEEGCISEAWSEA